MAAPVFAHAERKLVDDCQALRSGSATLRRTTEADVEHAECESGRVGALEHLTRRKCLNRAALVGGRQLVET